MKKPGTPNSITCEALASFSPSRAGMFGAQTGVASEELTSSQNSRSRVTREGAGLPAMIAALIAPIEMPATQVGSR